MATEKSRPRFENLTLGIFISRGFGYLHTLHEQQKPRNGTVIPFRECSKMLAHIKLTKSDVKELLAFFENMGLIVRANKRGIRFTALGEELVGGRK